MQKKLCVLLVLILVSAILLSGCTDNENTDSNFLSGGNTSSNLNKKEIIQIGIASLIQKEEWCLKHILAILLHGMLVV